MDRREAILVRLLAIAGEVAAGLDAAFEARRNETELPDSSDWVVLLDGEEIADEGDNDGRTPMTTPRRMVMTPEVQFRRMARTPEVGTKLNAARAALIPAVLGDAGLLELCNGKRKVRYLGARTVVERARKVDGAMGVGFECHYVLKPEELVVTA